MSNPENPSRLEELAALHALDQIDDAGRRELFEAAARDPKINALIRDYAETAALLAHDAPQVAPRAGLRREILDSLPGRTAARSKVVPFSQWMSYAIAACLMALGILQNQQITGLKSRLAATQADADRLGKSNALIGMKLTELESKDAAYNASKIIVAWDPYQHRGLVSMQALPPPPAGHDYQLWVLDPGAPAPISAGLLTDSRSFSTKPVTSATPGFAVSLEPAGGVPEPTGPILFAIAPGP
jgi:anti-sigma-K factor RskA